MVNGVKKEKYQIFRVASEFHAWFDGNKKFAFFAALLIGCATHYLQLVNQYLSQDGIVFSILYSAGNFETSVGRWGIDAVDSIRQNESATAWVTVMCLVLMAMGIVLIVDLLQIQHKFSVLFLAAAFMTAPSFLVTMLYSYCADAYMISFVCAILSVYCMERIRVKAVAVISSALCMMLSLAIYQNYAGIAVGLYLIMILQDLLKKEESVKEIFKRACGYLCEVICGGVLYYAVSKIIWTVMDITPSGKGGIGNLSLISILTNLKVAGEDTFAAFVDYFFSDDIISNTNWHREKLYLVLFIVIALSLILIIWKKKIYREPLRLIFIAFCVAAFPFAVNAIFLLIPGGGVYSLNAMQMVLVFPLLFVVLENDGLAEALIIPWCGVLVSAVLMFTYYSSDIFSYEYLEIVYDQMGALTNRVIDRMENTEGYYPGMPCTIVGIPSQENYPIDGVFRKYGVGDILDKPLFHGDYNGSLACWRKFAILYAGENLQMSEYTGIIGTDEFRQMGIYPAENSVQIINGIMTVKFTEDPVLP